MDLSKNVMKEFSVRDLVAVSNLDLTLVVDQVSLNTGASATKVTVPVFEIEENTAAFELLQYIAGAKNLDPTDENFAKEVRSTLGNKVVHPNGAHSNFVSVFHQVAMDAFMERQGDNAHDSASRASNKLYDAAELLAGETLMVLMPDQSQAAPVAA